MLLLIEIGERIGALATVGLVVGTGILGASVARHQGLSTLARLRADSAAGRLPTESIVEGVLILVAAAVLLTPGVLTDVAGFLCLIPACRRWIRRALLRRLGRAVRAGQVGMAVGFGGALDPLGHPPMKNVTPQRPGARDRDNP